MIDVVIPLGKGSIWQDNELRYCLRSIEKYLTGVRNIYLIGEQPDFIKDVIRIPYEDVQSCKETNIYKKVVKACEDPGISENFLFFNDDHFLLAPFEASSFPFFNKGNIKGQVGRARQNQYYFTLLNCYTALSTRKLPTVNFDTHTPILFNKSEYLRVMGQYDWEKFPGYAMKSLYANSLQIESTFEPDCKINGLYDASKILEIIKDRKVFSVGNKGIGEGISQALQQLYPIASKWEIV